VHERPRDDRTRSAARGSATDERPRERLLRLGACTLSDAELLAVLLGVGHASTGESALDQARTLLARLGSLRRLERATARQLRLVCGVGAAAAARLQAAVELGRRLASKPLRAGDVLRSSRDVDRHYRGRLAGLLTETFHVVLLDTRNRILGDVKISEGTLSSTIVHPREVFRPGIEEGAAALILVHNHPSGDPAPSAEDLAITRRLRDAGELVGIKVLDHVIVAASGYTSLVERGVL
jgi:DNA repair protein RadC